MLSATASADCLFLHGVAAVVLVEAIASPNGRPCRNVRARTFGLPSPTGPRPLLPGTADAADSAKAAGIVAKQAGAHVLLPRARRRQIVVNERSLPEEVTHHGLAR